VLSNAIISISDTVDRLDVWNKHDIDMFCISFRLSSIINAVSRVTPQSAAISTTFRHGRQHGRATVSMSRSLRKLAQLRVVAFNLLHLTSIIVFRLLDETNELDLGSIMLGHTRFLALHYRPAPLSGSPPGASHHNTRSTLSSPEHQSNVASINAASMPNKRQSLTPNPDLIIVIWSLTLQHPKHAQPGMPRTLLRYYSNCRMGNAQR
jgi:hypothetical protein